MSVILAKVRTQPEGTVIIEGKHEERAGSAGESMPGRHPALASLAPSASGTLGGQHNLGRQSAMTQQFSRRFTLPTDCDPQRVMSNLSRDGVLVVTAPRRRELSAGARGGGVSARDRTIPVNH